MVVNKMSKIKLSILCITYNHEKFIRDTLEGFITQKTNFLFEVLIHDDASTDNTVNIIREYEKQYPDIIKPIYQKENQYSKGVSISKTFNFPRVKGEYVAMCEGDDYWIDHCKLQKQVDFLDKNLDYNICFHPVREIYENNSHEPEIFPSDYKKLSKQTLGLPDLLENNFISTSSVVYRWILKNQEDLFPTGIMPGDWFLHLLHAQKGKICCLLDIMSVYRRHSGGVWWNAGKNDNFFIQHGIKFIKFYQMVEKQFHCSKQLDIDLVAFETIFAYLKHSDFDKIKQFTQIYPELYKRFLIKEYNIVDITSERYRKKYHKYKRLCIFMIFFIIVLCFILKV